MQIDESGIGIRSYFAFRHLRNARRCASGASDIEHRWTGSAVESNPVHEDPVISSIISSGAFLEAMINEVFSDAAHGEQPDNGGMLEGMSETAVEAMAEWWTPANEKMPTLEKYQQLLRLNDQPTFDRGGEPYQSAAAVIDLRNRLVHYRPETVYTDTPPRP